MGWFVLSEERPLAVRRRHGWWHPFSHSSVCAARSLTHGLSRSALCRLEFCFPRGWACVPVEGRPWEMVAPSQERKGGVCAVLLE